MKEIFEFKRFWTYFKYDLNNAKHSYLLTAFIFATLPITTFIVASLVALAFDIESFNYNGASGSILVFSIVAIILQMPTKIYGDITDKKYGSDWQLIPVSSFEKSLSMIAITCIVFPALFFTIYLASDTLMSAIFPSYGNSILGFANSISQELLISFNTIPILWAVWSVNILFFTLGTLVFKKHKIGKTFLCYILINAILLVLMIVGVIGIIDEFDIYDFSTIAYNEQTAIFLANLVLNIVNFIGIALLSLGIYFRIKTLKY